MEKIVDKIYIITKDDNIFNRIKKKLDLPTVPTVKVNGLTHTDIDDKVVNSVTTNKCKYLCSNKTVSQWLTHYNLWRNVYDSKEVVNAILIIDETGKPINSFNSMFEEFW